MCSGGVRDLGLEENLFLYLAFYFLLFSPIHTICQILYMFKNLSSGSLGLKDKRYLCIYVWIHISIDMCVCAYVNRHICNVCYLLESKYSYIILPFPLDKIVLDKSCWFSSYIWLWIFINIKAERDIKILVNAFPSSVFWVLSINGFSMLSSLAQNLDKE